MFNNKFKFSLASIFALFFLVQCNHNDDNKFILDENFNNNQLGWPEEETSSHQVKINKGYYFINSIDTSSYRSSAYSLKDEYLQNLPSKYVIKTSFNLLNKKRKEGDITNFGLLLNSSSLEYEFSIYWHGLVKVTKHDNNKDTTITIFKNQLNKLKSPVNLDLKIHNTSFELFVNGDSVGKGKFKTQTKFWYNLRLYTTTGSTILIDYLKILK